MLEKGVRVERSGLLAKGRRVVGGCRVVVNCGLTVVASGSAGENTSTSELGLKFDCVGKREAMGLRGGIAVAPLFTAEKLARLVGLKGGAGGSKLWYLFLANIDLITSYYFFHT